VTEYEDIERGDVETAKRYLAERGSVSREELHMIGMLMDTSAQMEAVFAFVTEQGIELTGKTAR
jgi:hypothetical protein